MIIYIMQVKSYISNDKPKYNLMYVNHMSISTAVDISSITNNNELSKFPTFITLTQFAT